MIQLSLEKSFLKFIGSCAQKSPIKAKKATFGPPGPLGFKG